MHARVVDEDDESLSGPGEIPRSWTTTHAIVEFELVQPRPFLDVEAIETRETLKRELAAELHELGVRQLDIPEVTGRDRRVSQRIARWAAEAGARVEFAHYVEIDPLYYGIRYPSKTDNQDCFAIFQRCELRDIAKHPIDPDDADVRRVFDEFDLRWS